MQIILLLRHSAKETSGCYIYLSGFGSSTYIFEARYLQNLPDCRPIRTYQAWQ